MKSALLWLGIGIGIGASLVWWIRDGTPEPAVIVHGPDYDKPARQSSPLTSHTDQTPNPKREPPQQQETAPTKPQETPSAKPQAVVVARHADAVGAGVFRYRLDVKAGDHNFVLICTEDENNIGKRDCNWGYNANVTSIHWEVRDCEWEVYDPITGRSENPKCVFIGLTVWEVTKQ